jgi:predicted RNA-binding Zn-ribbon protein involved in translation (DUF1610 family)
MRNEFFTPGQDRTPGRHQPGRLRSTAGLATGFTCTHCGGYVTTAQASSGVRNRNHCPYCLWSRHVGLYSAGDRLAACKAPMFPIGLTLKATHNRYRADSGELMLIHLCSDCGSLSINRIAADDIPETILGIFEASLGMQRSMQERVAGNGIRLLRAEDARLVRERLYGRGMKDG